MKREKNISGSRTDAPVEKFSLIANDTLLALYRNLLRCRVPRGSEEGRSGKRGMAARWPFDAAAVAVAQDLLVHDTIVAGGLNPVLALVREATTRSSQTVVRTHMARQTDCTARLQAAIGAALSHKTSKTGRVSVVFRHDGPGEDRDESWRETLEIARTHRLPMILVFASDGDDRSAAHASRSTIELEPGTELPHIISDGDDAVAMYRVAHEAVDRARHDRGPTLIECIRFALSGRGHRDALANMESYLRGKSLLRRGLRQEFLKEIAQEADAGKKRTTSRVSG